MQIRLGSSKRCCAVALLLGAIAGYVRASPEELPPPSGPLGSAVWIAADAGGTSESPNAPHPDAPLPLFRHSFSLPARPVSASLRISGLGQYEARLNGAKITEAVLTPGWTLYSKHVFFDSYEVGQLLRPGRNALSVMLGNGMYNVLPDPGRYSKFERSFGHPKLIAELIVHFADRADLVIASGPDWTTHPGPITFSHVYGGEDFDARREPLGWEEASYDDSAWPKAMAVGGPGGALVQETTPPIKAMKAFRPLRTTHPKASLTVYDLGQNFAGWPEIAVTGPAGASIQLLAGELLTPSGEVTQRSANQGPGNADLFTYTLRGGATRAHPEVWHPRFSYTGFRYVQAERSAPGVTILRLEGRFLHDDVKQIGTFASSDPLLNRIHALIDNAMLSNMVSVLTDCPQREKLGWLEQSHLAGTALNYNWKLARLDNKISNDMADSQQPDGLVPSIAPEYPVFSGPFRDSPEWGSAVVLTPWIAYQFSADPLPLRQHYDSMRRYVAYLAGRTHQGLLDYGLGDWYDIGPGEPGESKLTTKGLTASAIYYQDLTTLARICALTGHAPDAEAYTAQAEAVKQAFNARFFHADTNLYDRGSQTAQAMPLVLGLVPQGHEQAVLAALVASVRIPGNHVTAGDVGFHYVVRALTDFGRSDVLFDMLSRTDAPSYGAQLAAGATSLTEAWDANPKSSQNHFMLGDAEEWFYRGLAGLDFDRSRKPGEQIRIAPAVIGTLTSASATLDSSLGRIESSWHRDRPTASTLTMQVEVPHGATAKVFFPPEYRGPIEQNGHILETRKDPAPAEQGNARRQISLPSGSYRFTLERGRSAAPLP